MCLRSHHIVIEMCLYNTLHHRTNMHKQPKSSKSWIFTGTALLFEFRVVTDLLKNVSGFTCLADQSRLFAECCDLCKTISRQNPDPLPILQVGEFPHFSSLAYFMGIFCCSTPFWFINMHDVMGDSECWPIKLRHFAQECVDWLLLINTIREIVDLHTCSIILWPIMLYYMLFPIWRLSKGWWYKTCCVVWTN